jgi:hypothetical protein
MMDKKWARDAARRFAVPLDESRSDRVSATLALTSLLDPSELERRLEKLQLAAYRRGRREAIEDLNTGPLGNLEQCGSLHDGRIQCRRPAGHKGKHNYGR